MKPPPTLSVDQATALAEDLIRELAEHPGDEDAVCAVMLRWLDVLDVEPLARVALAAISTTFGRCLTLHDGPVPPGATTLEAAKAGAA